MAPTAFESTLLDPLGLPKAAARSRPKGAPGRVRLWTLQTQGIAKALEAGEPFVSNPDFEAAWGQKESHPWGFRQAYGWMAERMRERVGPPPAGCRHPAWAWARPPAATASGAPDMRSMRCENSDALIELSVPAELALLSNFGAWHSVLNGWPHSPTEGEDEAIEARVEAIRAQAGRLPERRHSLMGPADYSDPRILELLDRSWRWIFEVEPFEPGEPARMKRSCGGDDKWADVDDIAVQACLWRLDPAHLVSWRPAAPRIARRTP